jgi:predicted nicotinamide N-methyase
MTRAQTDTAVEEPRHRRGARRVAGETHREVQKTWDVPGQSEWRLGDRCIRLARAGNLAAAIDVDEQLRAANPSEPPYWMHVWPGAVALARMIAGSPIMRSSLRVLELGCGLALPAVTAAACGAQVVATDRVDAPLRLARRSAECSGTALAVLQMDWTRVAVRAAFDLCLGADIGYDFGRAPLLAAAVRALVRPGGWLWLADSVNTHRDDLLVALETEGFTVQVRSVREEEEGRPVWVRIVEAQAPA